MPFTVITDHRALLSIMREKRANKSNSCLTRWVDRLLPFYFSIDHLPGSKMGLVDYIYREPQQKAVNLSTYDEQFIVAKLDAFKRRGNRFMLNAENYTNFAARSPLIKPALNNPHSNDKVCSGFPQRNREYSETTQNSNTISKLKPNYSHSNDKIENANILHSIFVLHHSTDQFDKNRIAYSFHNILMMSQSDEETLVQIRHSTPSKVRFADEAGSSTAPSVPAKPSTPNTDTMTVTSPSTDDLYTNAFNFALSKIFSSTLMASLISKDAILKEFCNCILTDNEDRCRQISTYINSFWKDLVKIGCVCIDNRIAILNSMKKRPMWKRFMSHIPGDT